jgi:hypothetical protein
MRFSLNRLAVLCLSLAVPPLLGAQQPEHISVESRDGATKLVLTDREIIFRFTEQGARDATAGVAPKAGKKNWNWMDDALQGAATGIENMRIVFTIDDVRDARYDGGALTLYMATRPLNAADTDRRGVFKYDDVPEDQAQDFLREFRRLKASALPRS